MSYADEQVTATAVRPPSHPGENLSRFPSARPSDAGLESRKTYFDSGLSRKPARRRFPVRSASAPQASGVPSIVPDYRVRQQIDIESAPAWTTSLRGRPGLLVGIPRKVRKFQAGDPGSPCHSYAPCELAVSARPSLARLDDGQFAPVDFHAIASPIRLCRYRFLTNRLVAGHPTKS